MTSPLVYECLLNVLKTRVLHLLHVNAICIMGLMLIVWKTEYASTI